MRAVCHVFPAEFSLQVQSLGQSARAFCPFCRADQHPLRTALFSRDKVEHPVHPIAQVEIDRARLPVERFGALGPPPVSVAGGVFLAAVGLGFGDPKAQYFVSHAVDDQLSQQIGGNLQRIPREEAPPQSMHTSHLQPPFLS